MKRCCCIVVRPPRDPSVARACVVHRPELSDSVFSWDDFALKVNNELLKNLGNLVQRSLSFVCSAFGGAIPAADAALDARDVELIHTINMMLKVGRRAHAAAPNLHAGAHTR